METVKECKKHGQLTIEQCLTITTHRGKYTNTICRFCHNQRAKDHRERQRNLKRENLEKERAHWLPDTVKECKKHGLLTASQIKLSQYVKGRYTKVCTQCLTEWRKKTEAVRVARKKAYGTTPEQLERNRLLGKKRYHGNPAKYIAGSKASQKRRRDELADRYIVHNLKCRGFREEDITPELIDIKRCVIKMKRIIKDRRGKNG